MLFVLKIPKKFHVLFLYTHNIADIITYINLLLMCVENSFYF